MKQLIKTGAKTTTLKDVDMPKITKDNEVLVKLHYCGVCMSEHYNWSIAEMPTQTVSTNPNPVVSFGHEPVGEVVEIGKAVTRVKPGDRVSGLFGGNSEYVLASEDNVFLIPDHVADEEAILEPLSCLISAVSKVTIPVVGDKVAVVGCGYMGCGAISLLAMRGAHVVAVDVNRESLKNALNYGAKEAYTPEELPDDYTTINNNPELSGFPLVMEWAETNESLDLAINMTRQCGQLAVGAYHTGEKRLVDMQQLNVKAIDCLSTHPREYTLNIMSCQNAINMLDTGIWNYKHVPTKVYPITLFDMAQDELTTKYGKYMKALVDWTKLSGEPYIID